MFSMEDYQNSAEYVRRRLGGFEPELLIILGSGLGGLADVAEDPVYISYAEIPNFVCTTAEGHANRFAAGTVSGKRVLMMQGRLHGYDGYSMQQVAYPVRVAKLLGADKLIITNAAGGVNTSFHAGQLMIISDYCKFTLGNPLMGANLDEFGPRFPDMSYTFDREYMDIFRQVAEERGDDVATGVYFYMSGPQYETPAEIRAIRVLGGDAVGMSTVPEVICANHAGMRILGVTLITNMAAGVLDQPLSGQEVIDAASAASERFMGHMREFLSRI